MENRIARFENPTAARRDERGSEPQRIDQIVAVLLAQYQTRFPEVRVAIVETPATVV